MQMPFLFVTDLKSSWDRFRFEQQQIIHLGYARFFTNKNAATSCNRSVPKSAQRKCREVESAVLTFLSNGFAVQQP